MFQVIRFNSDRPSDVLKVCKTRNEADATRGMFAALNPEWTVIIKVCGRV